MNKKVINIASCAMIAAIYVVLTVSLSGLSYGSVQFRIAEALTVLPYFSSLSIWGLTVGCFISNIFSPIGLLDIIVGTSATLISALLTHLCAKKKLKWLAPIPPVVINAVFIGLLLMYESGVCTFTSFIGNAAGVALGQIAGCCVLGYPLMILIEKKPEILKYLNK